MAFRRERQTQLVPRLDMRNRERKYRLRKIKNHHKSKQNVSQLSCKYLKLYGNTKQAHTHCKNIFRGGGEENMCTTYGEIF